MTLSNGRSKRTLQCDSVLLDRVDGLLRDSSLSVNEDWRDVYLLPVDRCLQLASDDCPGSSPCVSSVP